MAGCRLSRRQRDLEEAVAVLVRRRSPACFRRAVPLLLLPAGSGGNHPLPVRGGRPPGRGQFGGCLFPVAGIIWVGNAHLHQRGALLPPLHPGNRQGSGTGTPPEGLSRYAVKMATGSGKTVVMALVIAWSWFHRRFEPGSDLAANFLVVAPNVIVYERLREDFDSRAVFNNLPIIPPEWKADSSGLQTLMRGDSRDPSASGNLFLTNIQQIYE